MNYKLYFHSTNSKRAEAEMRSENTEDLFDCTLGARANFRNFKPATLFRLKNREFLWLMVQQQFKSRDFPKNRAGLNPDLSIQSVNILSLSFLSRRLNMYLKLLMSASECILLLQFRIHAFDRQ